MFDLGFSELVVIAIVLLVVVGPERLPGVARTAGHLFGRMQRYISDVKADIRREMQLDELKKFQQQSQALEKSLYEGVGEIQSEMQKALSLPENETSSPVAPPQEVDATIDADAQDGAQELQLDLELDAPPAPTVTAPAKPVDSV